jgi:hypothetical protein
MAPSRPVRLAENGKIRLRCHPIRSNIRDPGGNMVDTTGMIT